jgi:hypothetical protein
LIRHLKHYHKSLVTNLRAVPTIPKRRILNNQSNLIDQPKRFFPEHLSNLTHLINSTQCNHTEWFLKTIIQILSNWIIIHHFLLNKVITQRPIDSLHQILYLYYRILDQFGLVLLFGSLVLGLLLLFEILHADEVKHVLDRDDYQLVNALAEWAEQIYYGKADECRCCYWKTSIDSVVLAVVDKNRKGIHWMFTG